MGFALFPNRYSPIANRYLFPFLPFLAPRFSFVGQYFESVRLVAR